MENLFIIGYGMSGGFGGIQNYEVIEAKSLEKAETEAYENACEHYEGHVGSNGLRDIDEIMEEDGIDSASEAQETFNEEREGWIEYTAEPFSKELEEKYQGYHWVNQFKEITDKL